jgi:hypothetical protein
VVYTIVTLDPAFRISRAYFPFVMPPVAKMAFGSKDVGGDGDGGIAGTAESSAESLVCNVVDEGSGDVSFVGEGLNSIGGMS